MMDKTLGSVDDLVGGAIWRLGAGGNGASFHRTDSEAAFQDFLKRIPSASNLSNLESNQLSSFGRLQGGGANNMSTSSLLLNANSIPAPPNMDVLGIPRVPSLDFLRQLAANQNGGMKLEQNAMPLLSPMILHPGLMMSDLASMNAATNAAALTASALTASALQTLPNFNMLQASMAQANANPASLREAMLRERPTAAKGRHQKEKTHVNGSGRPLKRPQQNSGNGTDDGTMSGSDDDDGIEGAQDGKGGDRKARRMLSNRESARRSRRRKQEHLSHLEQEINALNEEKEDLMNQVLTLQGQVAELSNLREENAALKEQIHKSEK